MELITRLRWCYECQSFENATPYDDIMWVCLKCLKVIRHPWAKILYGEYKMGRPGK